MGLDSGSGNTRARRFAKHLIRVTAKNAHKEEEIKKIKSYIWKIRKIPPKKKSDREKLDKEIDKLEKRISEVIEKERDIIVPVMERQKTDELLLKNVDSKLEEVEARIDSLGYVEERLSEQLSIAVKEIKEMRNRFSGVDKRLSSLSKKEKEEMQLEEGWMMLEKKRRDMDIERLKSVEEQLMMLEKKHREFSKDRKFDKSELKNLKIIIDSHKKRIEKIKKGKAKSEEKQSRKKDRQYPKIGQKR